MSDHPYSDSEMNFRFEVDIKLEGMEDRESRMFVKRNLSLLLKELEDKLKDSPYLPNYMSGAVKEIKVRIKNPRSMRPVRLVKLPMPKEKKISPRRHS